MSENPEERNFILSIDIGGSSCKLGLVDARGTVEEFRRYPTQNVREWGPEGFVEHLRPLEREYSIDGVAMGIPATVDWDHNNVRSQCESVPWLADSSNKKKLQDGLSRPILLMNDVEALLVGEWIWGELKGLNSGVLISLGTNMGSALLWDELPQQGRRGSIMELEHMSLDTHGEQENGMPPGAGKRWLSGGGLRNRMEERGEVLALQELFESEEDPYLEIRQTFEEKLAHLLGNIVMMLDPERIVLGGGLTRSHERWLPNVKDRMDRFVMEQFRGLPSVNLARLRGPQIVKGPAAFWDWIRGDER